MSLRKTEEQDELLEQQERRQRALSPRSPRSLASLEAPPTLSREEKAKALVKLGSPSVTRLSRPGRVCATTIDEAHEKLLKEEKATQRRLDAARKKAHDEQLRLEGMEHRSQRRFTRSMAKVAADTEQRKQATAAQLETWKKAHEQVETKFADQEEEFRRTKSLLEHKEIAKEEHIEADRELVAEKRREKFDAVTKNLEYRQQVVATAKEEYHRRCSEVVANKQKKVAEAKAKVAAEKAAEQLRRQEVVNETRARQQAKREAAEQAAEARKLELKQEVARKEALLAERRRVKQELVDSRIREAEAFELEKSNLQATLDNELAQTRNRIGRDTRF